MSKDYSRRSVLKLGGGLVSIAALGGCTSVLSDDGGSSGDLDAVPAGSIFVAKIDVERVLADETLRERVNTLLQNQRWGNAFEWETIDELLDTYETNVGLDQRAVTSALFFNSKDDKAGVIIDADWTESDIQSALEQNRYESNPDSYNGKSVYSLSGSTDFGVLSAGRYVLGESNAVENCIDVVAGDSESVSGTLVERYDATQEGYVQFALTLEPDYDVMDLPEPLNSLYFLLVNALQADNELPGQLEKSDVKAMQYVSGAMYRGDTRGAAMEVAFDSSESAKSLQAVLAGGKTLAAGQFSGMAMPPGLETDPEEMLRSTSIEQDGSTVMIENTTDDGVIEAIVLAVLLPFFMGFGESSNSGASTTAPNVNFELDYSTDGTVTITHEAGDSVAANQLYIEGNNLQTGRWDQLKDSIGPTDPVSAGNSITLEAESDYEVRIIWRSEDTEISAILYESAGPDA